MTPTTKKNKTLSSDTKSSSRDKSKNQLPQNKSKNQLPQNKLVQIKQKTFFDDYWKNSPHVPDSEYYSHGD